VAQDAGGQAVGQHKEVVTVFAFAGQWHGTVAVAVPKTRHCGLMHNSFRGAHVVGVMDVVTVGHGPFSCP